MDDFNKSQCELPNAKAKEKNCFACFTRIRQVLIDHTVLSQKGESDRARGDYQ